MEINKDLIEDYIASGTNLREYCKTRGIVYSRVISYIHKYVKTNDKDLYSRYRGVAEIYGKLRKYDNSIYDRIIYEYLESNKTLKDVAMGYDIKLSQLSNYVGNVLCRVNRGLYDRYKAKVKENRLLNVRKLELYSLYNDIIEEYLRGGVTMRSVSSRYNINEQSIYNYIHNYLSWKEDNDLYRRYIDRKQKKMT